LTTYGRFNKISKNLRRYDPSPLDKVFNPDRMQAVTVQDALLDPHLTLDRYTDPLYKDPGYNELSKRDTIRHDAKSKIFTDYKNNLIIKLDHSHGLRNGGLYYQTTFGRDPALSNDTSGLHSGKKMSKFGTTAEEIFKVVPSTVFPRVEALGQPTSK
jgi:hypothetical protein